MVRALQAPAEQEGEIAGVDVTTDDPASTLEGAEVRVVLAVRGGLDPAELDALLRRLQAAWAADPLVRERVDSLAVKVRAA